MNRVILLLLFMTTTAMSQSAHTIAELRTQLETLIRSHKGDFAVAFSDLKSGERLLINERTNFHAASTMKTPVMIEIFRQVSANMISLDDSVVVRNSFRSIMDGSEYAMDLSDDSDDGLYRSIGKKQTVRELVTKMITVSSNLATNILIEMAGPDNITRTMREMGCNDIRVLRGVEDGKAFAAGYNNTTTAYDLMLIFEQLAQKKVVDAESSDEMLAVLRAQKFKDMIPALLPKDVIVAHKTGSITNVQHDSGIITLPDGHQYVLILLSKNLKDNKDGIEVLAQLSKAVYDFVRK